MNEPKALKKCRCGLANSSTCKNCSKVRMTVMLKNGNDELKFKSGNSDKLFNPVWYSYLKYNRYDENRIADKMAERIKLNPKYAGKVQQLRFYRNGERSQPFKIERL